MAIVAGSEPHGLAPDAAIDEWVRIEHRGRAESLNVAMATTVICFEAARARRLSPVECLLAVRVRDTGQARTMYSAVTSQHRKDSR